MNGVMMCVYALDVIAAPYGVVSAMLKVSAANKSTDFHIVIPPQVM